MDNYIVKSLTHYCNITVPYCEAISEHVIDFYDFTYVTEGTMTYVADGVKIELAKNDAIFLKPGTRRERLQSNGAVGYVSFNFITFPDVELPLAPYLKKCISADAKRLFTMFSQEHLSPNYHSAQKCVNLLNYILFELLDERWKTSSNPHIHRILSYIEEHLHERLSLREISKAANLSPEYTAALFKREVGKTVTEYVNEKKLLLAKNLITGSNQSLQEISSSLGFENYHYFSRLFKKHFDAAPVKLRRRNQY